MAQAWCAGAPGTNSIEAGPDLSYKSFCRDRVAVTVADGFCALMTIPPLKLLNYLVRAHGVTLYVTHDSFNGVLHLHARNFLAGVVVQDVNV